MAFISRNHNGVVYHTSTLLEGVAHGFSTRLGGVSRGVFASLNFRASGPDPDDRESVQENYRRFCAAVGADPAGLALSKQVHRDTVRHVTAGDRGKGFSIPSDYTADALVTDEPGLGLMVFSADCIILLLHDPVTASIGAVHAGWRGTALDLPAKAAGEMGRLFGAKPEDIRIAIGAGIGPCCFETHGDVPNGLRSGLGEDAAPFIRPLSKPGKFSVDLKGANARWLERTGLRSERIAVCPVCTACNLDEFWSHRVQGNQRGSMAAMIQLA